MCQWLEPFFFCLFWDCLESLRWPSFWRVKVLAPTSSGRPHRLSGPLRPRGALPRNPGKRRLIEKIWSRSSGRAKRFIFLRRGDLTGTVRVYEGSCEGLSQSCCSQRSSTHNKGISSGKPPFRATPLQFRARQRRIPSIPRVASKGPNGCQNEPRREESRTDVCG